MKNIKTKLLTPDNLKEAAEILKKNGLVAFPTETVYGLGANALSAEAVGKIFTAKGRPSDNPLIVHIVDVNGIYPLITDFPDKAKELAEKFWPGPLSIVLPAANSIPDVVSGGLPSVAIRIPDHPVALRLLLEAGVPIAAPSANISGRPSPTNAAHVLKDLEGKIDAIVDGGECGVGVESTVIDFTADVPVILRPGAITREMIEDAIGRVEVDTTTNKAKPRSPGMKYTHYSPQGEVFLVSDHGKELAEKLEYLLTINTRHELRTAFLISTLTAQFLKKEPDLLFAFNDQEDAAHNLYNALRVCDDKQIDIIYCETYKKNGIGLALMNRLRKAAGNKII